MTFVSRIEALRPIISQIGPLNIVAGAVFAFTSLIFYFDALANLFERWSTSDELGHSYFIPIISIWLIWTNRNTVLQSIGSPSNIGLIIIVASSILSLFGKVVNFYFFQHLGLWGTLVGVVFAYGGFSLLRVLSAPLLFLLLAIPPPHWLMTALSWRFQDISSVLGVFMLRLADVPVFLNGNIIDLGSYQLQVAEACSGLRYLFPFLSLGVIAAYLLRTPYWAKMLVVFSVIPITIIMNAFRIAVTGFLVANFGSQHADGFLHFFEGWVVFLMCLGVLAIIIKVLLHLTNSQDTLLDAMGAPALTPVRPQKASQKRLNLSVRSISSIGALSTAAFIVISIPLTSSAYIKPERRTFTNVPYEFAGWEHQVQPLHQAVEKVLGADDFIVVDLNSPQKEQFNLYMAYLEERRDGSSWHSPRQCIPGGGWRIVSHEIVPASTPTSGEFHLNRLIIKNQDKTQLLYYWYDQRGGKYANEFVMRIMTLWDSVFRRRADGSLIRLLTPVSEIEDVAAADERLKQMVIRVDSFLPYYVPR